MVPAVGGPAVALGQYLFQISRLYWQKEGFNHRLSDFAVSHIATSLNFRRAEPTVADISYPPDTSTKSGVLLRAVFALRAGVLRARWGM